MDFTVKIHVHTDDNDEIFKGQCCFCTFYFTDSISFNSKKKNKSTYFLNR